MLAELSDMLFLLCIVHMYAGLISSSRRIHHTCDRSDISYVRYVTYGPIGDQGPIEDGRKMAKQQHCDSLRKLTCRLGRSEEAGLID